MKNLLLTFVFSFIYFLNYSQEIKLTKDLLIHQFSTDSMHYMDRQKIIPFKDSGIITAGYSDSAIAGQPIRMRVVVRAFSKNFDSLWTVVLPFEDVFSTLSLCTDADYNVYLTYDRQSSFNMVKIDMNGQLLFDKPVSSLITSNITIINKTISYNNGIIIYGNIFISQTEFKPFIAFLNKNGQLKYKHIFPSSVSLSYRGLYNCSYLTVTRENNLAFSFQLDASDNYKIYCYDSLFNEKWNKTFNESLGFNNQLFSQGGQVVFTNFDDNGTYVAFYKYDSKTGAGGTRTESSYSFTCDFNMFSLPTRNGNYLVFGNYITSGGFDNAIDYFDMNEVLKSVKSNTISSRNRVSDACIIGNDLYTVAIRFSDKYCIPGSGVYRGNLWLKKFNTDFLTQQMSVKDVVKTGNEMSAYPNPFNTALNLRSETGHMAISAINETGVSIDLPFSFSNGSIAIDTRTLAPGLYLLQVLNMDNGQLKSMKVVKAD